MMAGEAHLNVFVSAVGASQVLITLREREGPIVARGRMPTDPRRGGRLSVPRAKLWWPRYMSETPGYLYELGVEVGAAAAAAARVVGVASSASLVVVPTLLAYFGRSSARTATCPMCTDCGTGFAR